MRVHRVLTMVALVVGVTAVAQADPAVIDFAGGGEYSSWYGEPPGDVVGWRFEVNSPLIVTDLGIWAEDTGGIDPAKAGLTLPHEVGIWDSSQTLLASTIVDPATAWLDGAFAYQSILPLALSTGETYTIGALYNPFPDGGPDQADFYISGAGSITVGPAVNWLNSTYPAAEALGFAYPEMDSASQGRFGPNFQYVPEPGTSSLLALGGLALLRRRRG